MDTQPSATGDGVAARKRGEMARRDFLVRAGVAGAAVVAPGLSGMVASAGAAGNATPKRGGRLRIGDPGAGTTETLDPATSLSLIDEMRDRQLYDTLAFFRPNWSLEMRLAESMTPRRNASEWQIKLRKGVTFHNGKALTADDVLATWRRILDPKTASGGSAALFAVDLARTKKVSSSEILVRLKQPQVDFPVLLTGREQSILPGGITNFKKPVGTGPFSFVSFTPGQRSLFKRNPNYWMNGQPYVDELEIISIADATARTNALVGGQVDAIDNLPFVDAKTRANDPSMKVVVSSSATCIPFCVQVDKPPFNKPDVIRALKLAADRPKMVETALNGFGSVGNDIFGKNGALYDKSIPQHTYDPERAKALLKKAGIDRLKMTLDTTGSTVGNVESSQAYAAQAKAAGIDVSVKVWDPAKFGSDIYNKTPAFQTYWNFPLQIMFPFALAKGAPYNETHFDNPAFARLYGQSQRTIPAGRRAKIFGQMERIIWDTGGYLIWGFIDFTDATSPKVQGLVKHPYFNLGAFQFRTWWLS